MARSLHLKITFIKLIIFTGIIDILMEPVVYFFQVADQEFNKPLI